MSFNCTWNKGGWFRGTEFYCKSKGSRSNPLPHSWMSLDINLLNECHLGADDDWLSTAFQQLHRSGTKGVSWKATPHAGHMVTGPIRVNCFFNSFLFWVQAYVAQCCYIFTQTLLSRPMFLSVCVFTRVCVWCALYCVVLCVGQCWSGQSKGNICVTFLPVNQILGWTEILTFCLWPQTISVFHIIFAVFIKAIWKVVFDHSSKFFWVKCINTDQISYVTVVFLFP